MSEQAKQALSLQEIESHAQLLSRQLLFARPQIRRGLRNKIRALVTFGVYEHYKSTPKDRKLYTIFRIIFNTKNVDQHDVLLMAHFGEGAGELNTMPLLGKDGFLNPVKRHQKLISRFRPIAPGISLTNRQALEKMGMKLA